MQLTFAVSLEAPCSKGSKRGRGKIRMKAKFPFSAFKFHTLSLDERNYEPITSY